MTSWKLNTVKRAKQLKKSHLMTLLKVLHDLAVENAEIAIELRNSLKTKFTVLWTEFIGNMQRQVSLLKWHSKSTGTTQERSSQTIWSWRWQTCENQRYRSCCHRMEGFDATEEIKKKWHDLAAEYNMISGTALLSTKVANTLSLWKLLVIHSTAKKLNVYSSKFLLRLDFSSINTLTIDSF